MREQERRVAEARAFDELKAARITYLPSDSDSEAMASRRALFHTAVSSTKHYEKVMEATDLCKARRQNRDVGERDLSDSKKTAPSSSCTEHCKDELISTHAPIPLDKPAPTTRTKKPNKRANSVSEANPLFSPL